MLKNQYRFIDLFAGLGGFHLALSQLGCKCVFASEIKEDLRKLYRINFPDTPTVVGDITKVAPEEVPPHDILCAGFPCQPFSQAGKRQGFYDEKERGNLFYNILDIIKCRRPRFVLLENVATLKNHDMGNTWSTIKGELEKAGYEVTDAILSPHQFQIPQHRRRIYIVCADSSKCSLSNFSFPRTSTKMSDIKKIVDEDDTDFVKLKDDTRLQLKVWQEFIDQTIAHGDAVPRFPVWAMEFGANYDFEETAPAYQSLSQLCGKRGKLGEEIHGSSVKDCLDCLPVYAQTDKNEVFPKWKISYIRQNRAFYARHKEWLDKWIVEISEFDNSHQKFEWNCGPEAKPYIYDNIVQFRASGIRVKLPTFSPALNLVGTQVPILPWVKLPKECLSGDEPEQGRYMTVREAAKLQGMHNLSFGNDDFSLSTTRIFEALGNAVNVTIVKHIAQNLLKND